MPYNLISCKASTRDINSSNPPCLDNNASFTMVPLKPSYNMIKYVEDTALFLPLKMVNSDKVTFAEKPQMKINC